MYIALIYILLAVCLKAMQRIFWCECGSSTIWITDVWSKHNSQHLFDPYSFSHWQHGVIFFAVLCALKRPRLEYALIIESLWEIIENTPFTIQRYRTVTMALDYFGDSIGNSLGDLTACMLGFILAARAPRRVTLLLYLLVEAVMIATIRDSLTLNVIMLLYPIDGIKEWQMGTS